MRCTHRAIEAKHQRSHQPRRQGVDVDRKSKASEEMRDSSLVPAWGITPIECIGKELTHRTGSIEVNSPTDSRGPSMPMRAPWRMDAI